MHSETVDTLTMHPLSDWYQEDNDEAAVTSFDPAKAAAAIISAPLVAPVASDALRSAAAAALPPTVAAPAPALSQTESDRSALEFLDWARTQTAAMNARAAAVKSAQPAANLLTPTPASVATTSSIAPARSSTVGYTPLIAAGPTASASILSMYAAMGGAPVRETIKANEEREELLEQLRSLVVERESLKTQIYDLQNLSPEHVVNLIVVRKPYTMSHLRSRDDKRKLLALAVATRSRDAIITVLFFLRDTLSPQIFVDELIRQPDALAVWRTHLKELGHWTALAALSSWQGRDAEAALQELRGAMREPDPEAKLSRLQQWVSGCGSLPGLTWTASQVSDQCVLLRHQIVLHRTHVQTTKAARAGQQQNALPPAPPPLHAPLAQVIYHLQCFHWKEPIARPTSPQHLLQHIKISEKRLLWLNLRARARMQDWTAVKALGEVDRWLLGPSAASCIGFEPFVEVLTQTGGPQALREHFCRLIEPPERRIQVAQRVGLPGVALDTLTQPPLRDWTRAHRLVAEHAARYGAAAAAPLHQRLEAARSAAK